MLAAAKNAPRWREQAALGVRDSLGVGIGIFPLGVALGLLVVQAGLPFWVTPALSIGVFAGSVELLMVSMLAAAAPLLTIAVAVFAVNFRHVFYALSFPMSSVRPGIPRAYSTYALIDEAYATYVLVPPAQLTSTRIVTGQLMMQAYWVIGGLLGSGVAASLAAPLEGFEFALTATFIVMTLDAVRSKREIPSALLAAGAVTIAIAAFPGNTMLAALLVFAGLLGIRYARAAVRRETGHSESENSNTGYLDSRHPEAGGVGA